MEKLQENELAQHHGYVMEDYESSSSMEELSRSINSEECSSLEMVEDASSSLSSSSSNGPLFELTELMVHLPMKRGLSKYYDGKSESFTSLASVERLEDLAKRVSPITKKFKSCKSFDAHKSIVPRAAIAKKSSRSRGKSSLICGSRATISVNGQ
ncbi:Oxidative stress 3, putative isoform 1 [Cucumis melo var. makuwa]|uniref:Uncharacterized protein LOC103492272 n=2 Tax=Cucumis melo TaxID=3656 RepID=A0A1S3BQQ6_CUCME|nr:protein OXIDATIVE STRESS 3-like [Cucumis melo]TYK10139.1 Oxidative stress 3, putative isoform 1 [Cucumis melo var. makuwa]